MLDQKIDFLITTFLRYDCLRTLLKSIEKRGYKNRIIVGDQNEEIDWKLYDEFPNVEVLDLEYDCGLSESRNKLVEASVAPFVLLLEDDFEFTPKTNIETMLELLEVMPDVGVVGGQVQQLDIPIHFEWIPEIKDGTLYHKPDGDHYKKWHEIEYKLTGCVLNFALFRRELFKDNKWDHELKLREHADFYLGLQKTKWQVIYCPEVVINDAKPRRYDNEYKQLKSRNEFMIKMMEKNGINRVYYQNGGIKELENGVIVDSYGPPLK